MSLVTAFVLYDFELAGRRVRLWQRTGETYAHVLMKALGYAMFVGEYPSLQIELRVGLRYKPDLVVMPRGNGDARAAGRAVHFPFWGECGMVSMRKVAWLLKHGGVERLTLFKINCSVTSLVTELREAVDARYRTGGRLTLINFAADIATHASSRRIERAANDWYTKFDV